jgi:hypothetical protein
MGIRFNPLIRAACLVIACATVVGSYAASAQAHTTKSIPAHAAGNVALPTTASARSIVTSLWSRREAALAALSVHGLLPIERASAKQFDTAYVTNVLCECEPQKDRHPAIAVLVQVPAQTVKPTFFAEVRTSAHQRHPWYLVTIERDRGTWKIALVAFGGYGAAPPLHALTNSNGRMPPVTGRAYARMTHLANASLAYGKAHSKRLDRTSYGATVRIRREMHPVDAGIYGLALPAGKVLSCFTMHSVETYSLPAVCRRTRRARSGGMCSHPGSTRPSQSTMRFPCARSAGASATCRASSASRTSNA